MRSEILPQSAMRSLRMELPRPGWAEVDAEALWWREVCAISAALMARLPPGGELAGMCVSGLGPRLVLCDADLRPLRPAILYGIAGWFLFRDPNVSLAITTLIIGWGLVIAAVFQGAIWFQTRSLAASGWRLFNVIITLILGLMVIFGWPESTAWFVGTLIAVELIFSGWTLLLYAFSGNSARR